MLPPTITDQIRLWELERDRLRFTEGEYVLVAKSWSLARERADSSVCILFFTSWTRREKLARQFFFVLG